MPGLTVNVILQDIKKLETEGLIVGFFQDVRPLANLAGELDWLLCGALSNLIINHKLHGTLGEVALLTSGGKVPAQKLFLVGLGPSEEVSVDTVRSAVASAVSSALGAAVKDVALECFFAASLSLETAVNAIVRGVGEGNRGGKAKVHLLAPDAARYEQISKILNLSSGEKQYRANAIGPEASLMTSSNIDSRRT